MGVFEWEQCSMGTKSLINLLKENNIKTYAGGGSTIEAINKFDHTRGTKAFSYFNVVAKNWLIIKSKQRTKQIRRPISLDDPMSISKRDMGAIESYKVIPAQDTEMIKTLLHRNPHHTV